MAWTLRVLFCVCIGLLAAPVFTARAQDDAGVKDPTRGEEAYRRALARLQSPESNERALAADELGRRGYRFRKEIAEVLRPLLVSDPDSVVRAAAGRALGRLGAREAIPELIKALNDRSAEVRVVAAAALWRLPDPSAVPVLLEHGRDNDKVVREWVAMALGVAADPRALPELVRLLDDPERAVRLAAVRSIGRVARPEGLRPLVGYLASGKRDEEEKDEVVNAVCSIEGTGRTSTLLELFGTASGDSKQKLRVVIALGKVGDAQALPLLRRTSARDESRTVREAATQAYAAVLGRSKSKPGDASPGAEPPRP